MVEWPFTTKTFVEDVALAAGHAQILAFAGEKLGIFLNCKPIRIQEGNPEMIIDNIQRNLASTNRAFDKSHDCELGFVEHELVA